VEGADRPGRHLGWVAKMGLITAKRGKKAGIGHLATFEGGKITVRPGRW